MVLCRLLARLRDGRGRIAIPGFYDEVVKLTRSNAGSWRGCRSRRRPNRRFLGVPRLFGEQGYTCIEQRAARPTVEINGLTSGYQGAGSKTIIPSWARAKLVPPGAGGFDAAR